MNSTNKCTDIFIDYCTMTWHPQDLDPESDMIHQFFDTFPQFSDLLDSEIKGGRYWYDECMLYSDNIRLWYCNPGSTNYMRMGVCLEVPSHGLEWLFNCLGLDKYSLVSLFNWAYENDFKVSRLDLTYDDYDRRFLPSFYELFWTLHPESVMTHFRTRGKCGFNVLSEDDELAAPFFMATGAKFCSQSFYLGNRKKGKLMRIYDKFYQSGQDPDKNCIRYEFELHREHCDALINFLLDNGGINFKELICSFFKLLDPDSGYESRSRIPLLAEWEEWLDSVVEASKHNFSEHLRVPRYTKEESFARQLEWVYRNRHAYAGLKYIFGEEFFNELTEVSDSDIPIKYKKYKFRHDLLCAE